MYYDKRLPVVTEYSQTTWYESQTLVFTWKSHLEPLYCWRRSANDHFPLLVLPSCSGSMNHWFQEFMAVIQSTSVRTA